MIDPIQLALPQLSELVRAIHPQYDFANSKQFKNKIARLSVRIESHSGDHTMAKANNPDKADDEKNFPIKIQYPAALQSEVEKQLPTGKLTTIFCVLYDVVFDVFDNHRPVLTVMYLPYHKNLETYVTPEISIDSLYTFCIAPYSKTAHERILQIWKPLSISMLVTKEKDKFIVVAPDIRQYGVTVQFHFNESTTDNLPSQKLLEIQAKVQTFDEDTATFHFDVMNFLNLDIPPPPPPPATCTNPQPERPSSVHSVPIDEPPPSTSSLPHIRTPGRLTARFDYF